MLIQLINLESRPDRLERFSTRAAAIGLRFERLPASDGSDPRFARAAAGLRPTPRGEVIGPRALACLDSHRRAWTRIAEGDGAPGAVFEDDIYIADDLGAILSDPSWMPADADVVRLETMGVRSAIEAAVSHTATGRGVHRLRSLHMGSAGYVVTPRGARRFLEGTATVFDTMDRMLFDFRSPLSRRLATFQMRPAPCIQADCAAASVPLWARSDINAERYGEGQHVLDGRGRPVRRDAGMAVRYLMGRAAKASRGSWAALRHGGRYRRIPYLQTPPGTTPPRQPSAPAVVGPHAREGDA